MKCIETIDFGPYLWSTSPSFKLSYNRWDIQVGFCFSVRKFSFSDYRILWSSLSTAGVSE